MARTRTPDPRQAAKEAGAALVLNQGVPILEASRRVQLPESTLRDAVAKLATEPEKIKEAADRLAAAHVTIAMRAAERLHSRLDDLPDDLVMRAYGIASDKVATHQGWGRDAGSHSGAVNAAEALARLADALSGKTLTVTVEASDPPIDVTQESNAD